MEVISRQTVEADAVKAVVQVRSSSVPRTDIRR
jgi:hypothetical protein